MVKIQFIKRRNRLSLSWFSRILILTIIFTILIFTFKNLNHYLSENDPIPSRLLVVEGFLPDYTLRNMMTEFYDGDYDKILISGKPIGQGYYLTGYKTSAQLMRTTLISMGIDSSLIHAISIPNTISRDRTYCTGLLLQHWLDTTNSPLKRINVYTLGSHARRSKYLFQKAVGKDIEIGIISGEDRSYNQIKWWKSSKGFRTVINESLAYLYVRLFFHADAEDTLKELSEGYYIDEISRLRNEKNIEFSKAEESPMTVEQLKTFVRLNYYPPQEKFKVNVKFVKDSIQTEFKMKTSTDRLPIYRNYGKLYFKIDENDYVLTAYQNVKYSRVEGFENYLFIPFRDLSCGEESYGAGRFIDFIMPKTDVAYIDFNLAYNPLCAYNHKYSCPIPPAENTLYVSITAGEKIYEKH